MFWATAAIIVGIALTVVSADKFVEGAASLASRLGMSHFLIGLTIVSVGTSAPELLVSAVAAYAESPGLALGNALGSNVTNIALVLGATACVFNEALTHYTLTNDERIDWNDVAKTMSKEEFARWFLGNIRSVNS